MPTKEYFALIPDQRDHINRLMIEGVITDVSLSDDRTMMWVNMNANSEEEVIETLNQFPMIRFMGYKIEKLMFHHSFSNTFQKLSLN